MNFKGNKLTLPGSVWAVNVVEPSNTALHAEVLGVMLAQLLGSKLLKTVSILGLQTKI
jgi:hypothetical protein